jgi:hypothetical protein
LFLSKAEDEELKRKDKEEEQKEATETEKKKRLFCFFLSSHFLSYLNHRIKILLQVRTMKY